MIKKLTCILLAITFVLAAASCTQQATPAPTAPAKTTEAQATPAQTTETTTPAETTAPSGTPIKAGVTFCIPNPKDAGGFDKAQYWGLMALKEQYGWEISMAEDVPYAKISESASSFLDKGYDIIFFPDNGMMESFLSLPGQYPDKWFVMVSAADKLPEGTEKAAAVSPNFYQYGLMVGIAAATQSKTGKIGVIGGSPIKVLETLFSGVIEGAKYVNPDSETTVLWAGDWVDTAKHKELGTMLTNDGCDVLFTVTGNANVGVFEAAEIAGAKAIGYAWDEHDANPNAIMTSVKMDLPKLYLEVADMYTKGTLENKIYSLDASYFTFTDFYGIDSDTQAKILEVSGKLQSGEITVAEKIHSEIMPK